MAGSSSSKRMRDGSGCNEKSESYDVEGNGGFFDDEWEPHVFGHSVLPVANLPGSYDGVPQDGMEYLFTVRREERRLPLVTRVLNPYAAQESPRLGFNDSPQVQTPVSTIPSEEWRTCFEERFRNLRANFRQPTIHVSVPSAAGGTNVPEMRDRDRWWAFIRGDVGWERVPSSQYHSAKKKKRNQETEDYEEEFSQGKMHGWVVYEEKLSWDQPDEDGVARLSYGGGNTETVEIEETGEDGEVLNEDSLFRESNGNGEVVLPTPRESPNPALSINKHATAPADGSSPREPTPELLSLLDQKTTFQLLKFFSQWIRGHLDHSFLPPPPPPLEAHPNSQGSPNRIYDFTPCHGRWIFALLCRLDAQLTSDEISLLRKLARDALQLIKAERCIHVSKASSVGEIACWMIVGAVSSVWGQKDLWIDAVNELQ